jgi:pimeloyl-ACP methyl ester carboxylesterase
VHTDAGTTADTPDFLSASRTSVAATHRSVSGLSNHRRTNSSAAPHLARALLVLAGYRPKRLRNAEPIAAAIVVDSFRKDLVHVRRKQLPINLLFHLDRQKRRLPVSSTSGFRSLVEAPAVQIADFKGIWPDRPIVKLPNAGHFSQEDEPDVLIALIQLFVQEKA